MHLLLAGSTIAAVSGWAVMPAADVFDTGLAGHFASAMQHSNNDCLASSVLVDGGSMLVVLDERGGITEVELGAMPAVAEQELRMAIPPVFAAATTPISPDALMCAAVGDDQEVDVQVEVANGGGTIVIEHNGDRREIEIDLGDIDFEQISEEMGEAGIDMHAVMGRLLSGGLSPEVQAEVVVEMVDDEGDRHRKRIHLGGNDDGLHERHMMMMFGGGKSGHRMPGHGQTGQGMGRPGMGSGHACPMCGGGGPRSMAGRGGHGGQGMMPPQGPMGHGGWGEGHGDMGEGHGDMAAGMLREHMHFLAEMHEDPERAWEIIESLPPEVRRAHEELLEQLMGGDDDDHGEHEFFERAGEFDEKITVARRVAQRLNDAEAMAVFGVWQAREHLDPEERIAMLAPMVGNERLRTSVRNAAAFVVMEAHGELDDGASAADALRDMILRNGVPDPVSGEPIVIKPGEQYTPPTLPDQGPQPTPPSDLPDQGPQPVPLPLGTPPVRESPIINTFPWQIDLGAQLTPTISEEDLESDRKFGRNLAEGITRAAKSSPHCLAAPGRGRTSMNAPPHRLLQFLSPACGGDVAERQRGRIH